MLESDYFPVLVDVFNAATHKKSVNNSQGGLLCVSVKIGRVTKNKTYQLEML